MTFENFFIKIYTNMDIYIKYFILGRKLITIGGKGK